jgi:predicted enzyme involved in methoxymalonyl-ACP biosynthesis
VLARGVEQYLMNHVVEQARSLGLRKVSGEYIPTAKNGMVTEFYAQFGFTKTSENNGHTVWLLDVDSFEPSETLMQAAEPAAVV